MNLLSNAIRSALRTYVEIIHAVDNAFLGKYQQCDHCKHVFERHDDSVGWKGSVCGECAIELDNRIN